MRLARGRPAFKEDSCASPSVQPASPALPRSRCWPRPAARRPAPEHGQHRAPPPAGRFRRRSSSAAAPRRTRSSRGNTSEVCGGNILDAVTAKLVHYNAETAAPELDIAETIETDDNKLFTVKLKKGYKFSDGTEVKAKNFVDAWNYTAYGPNGQQGGYFYEPIAGFADLQCTGRDKDAAGNDRRPLRGRRRPPRPRSCPA